MTREDSVAISQLVGAIKRARSTVNSTGAQINEIVKRNAGESGVVLCEGGLKCLLTGLYWLDQAVEVFESFKRIHKEASS